MAKNWLIRTKTNHILGPVSKDKVLELLKKKSVSSDDEICSGNGYWFSTWETDHIESYIIQDHKMPFNPIKETDDILTSDLGAEVHHIDIKRKLVRDDDANIVQQNDSSEHDLELEAPQSQLQKTSLELEKEAKRKRESKLAEDTDAMLPSDSDLEYPEVEPRENTLDDITVVGQINLGELNSGEAQEVAKRQVNAREKRSQLPPPSSVEESTNYEDFSSLTDPDIGHISAGDMAEQTRVTPLQIPKDDSLQMLERKKESKGLIQRNMDNVNSHLKEEPKKRDDRLMAFFLLSILLIVLILLALKKFKIIDKILPPANSAVAQEIALEVKKKNI